MYVKGLWRLYYLIVLAIYILALCHIAEGFCDRHHGDYGFLHASLLIAALYYIEAHKRSHAIVDADNAFCEIGNGFQAVLHRVEACLAAIDNSVGDLERIFPA